MPITMMCSELRDAQFQPTGEWPEGSYCPLDWNRQRGWTEGGAPLCEAWAKHGGLVVTTTHHGLVLELGERNGRDDSDFYARVWNPETGQPLSIEYASTRGWSYPNNATVDATPEVRAAYNAWHEQQAREARARREQLQAALPAKGDRVLISAAKGKATEFNGRQGELVWIGADSYNRYGHRVGVKVPGQPKAVFLPAGAVRKIMPDGLVSDEDCETSLRAAAAARVVSAYARS